MNLIFSFLQLFLSFSQEPILVTTDKDDPSKKFSNHYGAHVLAKDKLGEVGHLDELIFKIPGMTSAGGTSRSRFFQLRGIGERSSYEGMPNESVTILFDDIDYTGVGGIFQTFGVENIEIYKGPQNTTIGPSALAGSIRANTETPPIGNFKARANLESFSGRELGLVGSHSLGNTKLTWVSNYKESDGYFKNTFLQRDDTNSLREYSLRSVAELSSFKLTLHYFDFNSGYDVFNLNNSKETRSEDPGRDDQRTFGASLVHILKMENVQLKSILSGHRTDSFYSYDEDWENSSSYDYRIGFDKKLRNLNWEERLSWGSGRVLHTTGVFFKNTHLAGRELGFNAEVRRKDLKSTFKRRRVALFHETEWDINTWTVFGGMRGAIFKSHYSDTSNVTVEPSENLWGGQVGIKKETVAGDLLSLRFSRGFKAGGVNIGSNITTDRRQFEEESLYEVDFLYEKDWKSVELKLNLFANYRDNIQVKTSFQDNPSDPSSFTFYTDNATSGSSFGGEGRLSLEPFSFYKFSLNGSMMKSQYGDYVYGTRNLKGRDFSYAPQYKFILAHNFSFKGSYFFEFENVFTDSFYFGNSHDERSPKTIMTDFKVGLKNEGYEVFLWGRNLFNERSESRGFFFGNRSPNFNNERFVQVGPPRMIGICGQINL